MKRLRGSGTQNSAMNRDNIRRPNSQHHGSGKPLGVLHAPPPPGGAVNSANYAGQKVKQK
jgi:hypothetical protein